MLWDRQGSSKQGRLWPGGAGVRCDTVKQACVVCRAGWGLPTVEVHQHKRDRDGVRMRWGQQVRVGCSSKER